MCPNARLLINTVPASSCSRISYSPGSMPRGKIKRTRSSFCGRWTLFRESSASSPRVGEKEDKSTLTSNGVAGGIGCLVVSPEGCRSICFSEALCWRLRLIGLCRSRVAAKSTASTARDAAVSRSPRHRSDIRRKCAYSVKQGEQPTICDTGMSPSAKCRSRRAIALKLDRLGHRSRSGFGNPLMDCFFPRAITSLISLEEANWLDSVIRDRSMECAFIRSTAASAVNRN